MSGYSYIWLRNFRSRSRELASNSTLGTFRGGCSLGTDESTSHLCLWDVDEDYPKLEGDEASLVFDKSTLASKNKRSVFSFLLSWCAILVIT